jgi:hypothetical protein
MQQHQLQELPVCCSHAVCCRCRPASLVPADQLLHSTVGAEAWQLNGVVALHKLPHILQGEAALGCRGQARETGNVSSEKMAEIGEEGCTVSKHRQQGCAATARGHSCALCEVR